MASESQGSEVKYDGEQIVEVLTLSLQPVLSQAYPVTHLTSMAAEKLVGVMDDGNIRIEAHYSAADAGLRACRSSRRTRARRYFIVDFGTFALICYAWCSAFQLRTAVNQQILCDVILEVDGAVAHAVELPVAWAAGIDWDIDIEWGEHWSE